MSLYVIDHKVIQNNQLVLLIVQLTLFLKHDIEGLGINKKSQSKIACLRVDFNNFGLRFISLINERTWHAESDSFANIWLTWRQVNFHRWIPYIFIDLYLLENLILNKLIQSNFFLDVFKDLVDIAFVGLFILGLWHEGFGEHGTSVLFVFVTNLI